MARKHTDQSAVAQFWAAPDESLVPQTVLAEVVGLSTAWAERARWDGSGPRFVKIGRQVRYRKADVLRWLDQQRSGSSTSEIASKPRRTAVSG